MLCIFFGDTGVFLFYLLIFIRAGISDDHIVSKEQLAY